MLGLEVPQRVLKQQQPITRKIPYQPSEATTASFVLQCGNAKDVYAGKHAHDHIVQRGLEGNAFLCGLLVQMYGKCDALEDAMALFKTMSSKHVYLWGSMIRAFARHGYVQDAFILFDQMQQEGVLPEQATYVCALSACVSLPALSNGILMHGRISGSSFESDLPVGNALVNMYGKCGNMDDACRTFMQMQEHDVISWTAIVSAYAQHGQGHDSLMCFDHMLEEAVAPNKITFISLLSAIVSPEYLSTGVAVHARIVNSEFQSDVNLGNTLINMYGKCGRARDAWTAFDHMLDRDVVSWNTVIAACALHGMNVEAFQIFVSMGGSRIKPNKTTFVSLLSACTSLTQGMQMHASIIEVGFELDVFVGTAVVSMYGKCGSFKDAKSSFSNMAEQNVISWNVMIAVYAQHAQGKEALELCEAMQLRGLVPSNVTIVTILDVCAEQGWLSEAHRVHVRVLNSGLGPGIAVGNALVNTYGKCGNTECARREFDKLQIRDVISWTSIITAYAQDGKDLEALQMFEQMQREGVLPDEVTYISVLYTCASQSKLAVGEEIYSCLMKKGYESDIALGTALINMYGRCGKLDVARRIFDRLLHKNMVSWTVMIAAHAYHGQGKEALQFYQQMRQEFVPDRVTFLSILAACSHAGLVDEGNYFLVCMRNEHGISPVADHYGCMIDLLGRAGQLDKAETLIKNIPQDPSVGSYIALLGACRYQGDIERAKRTAKHMFDADLKSSSPYVMLSNIYVTSGMGDDGADLTRKDKGETCARV